MYRFGADEDDRKIADDLFLQNMFSIIESSKFKCWENDRKNTARTYYRVVRTLGGSYFNRRRKGKLEYG